ncbi:DUF4347 domain-containing protein [Psychromonas sp.]|uniref:DUF4347 domain-containing protein n=1 Tax=Psychromonas sp. TaxID=1884585 RepID=UPI003A988548
MSKGYYELEPRVLLDAAALVTASEVNDSQSDSADVAAKKQVDNEEKSEAKLAEIESLSASLVSLNSSADNIDQIVFIDSRVTDSGYTVDADENTLVIILDANENGIDQITETLSQYDSLSSIQIISHGDDGELLLGSTNLNSDTLADYNDLIATWQDATEEGADLLLFGCNVAETETGQEFVQEFALLTGLDVAASVDDTGSDALGGDWDLEYTVGDIEAESITLLKTDASAHDLLLSAGANDDSASTEENTSLSGNVLDNDTATGDKVVTAVNGGDALNTDVEGSDGGIFTVDGDGNYSFEPGTDFDYLADGESQTISITYTLTDVSDNTTETATITITVTGTDDTAEITDSSATFDEESNLNNPTQQIITNTELNTTDPESEASEIVYTLLSEPSAGQLNLDGTVLYLGDIFTQDEIDNGLLSYVNDGSEVTADNFTYEVVDRTGNTLNNQVFDITITAYNDPLEADSSLDPDEDGAVVVEVSIGEGESLTFSDTELLYNDADNSASQIVFTIETLDNDEGVFSLDGVTLSVGDTFTQADITAGLIIYQHNGEETTGSEGFTYSVTDGDISLTGSVVISVTPINMETKH